MTPPLTTTLDTALRLLRSVREADVIFAKTDWPLSQEIAAFLSENDKLAAQPAPPAEALRLLRELADATYEERKTSAFTAQAWDALQAARRYLAATEEGT